MTELFRLDGRTVVVTGALGKLETVWTRALLDAGANVAALDVAEAPTSETFTALQATFGARLACFQADITERPALEAARESIHQRFGAPQVLVNNAGIDQPPSATTRATALEDIPLEVSRRIFEVNTLGALLAAQVFGPGMIRAGGGSIINVGSLYASVAPDPRLYDHIPSDPPFLKPPAYGASKAALVNLTKYLAVAWGPHGVRVNALSPGGVLGAQDETFKRKFCDRVPLRRMAVAADLVGPLLFLAADASKYVTGAELRVDGGFTAW